MHIKKLISNLIFILIGFQSHSVLAQSSTELINYFDSTLEPAYEQFDYNNAQTPWWQGWGWNLMAYLRMYEATEDITYLHEFIRHSLNIQQLKGTNQIWSKNMHNQSATIVLYTGQLLHPMAEFVYLIRQNEMLKQNLIYSTNLPAELSGNRQSFADYANWLELKVDASLQYLEQTYWINNSECFAKRPLNRFQRKLAQNGCTGIWNLVTNCPSPIEINFNASYGATMLYMGKLNPSKYAQYTWKGEAICTYFKTRLRVDTLTQSFVWNHNNDPDCFALGLPCIEDVSHGAIDIQLPIVAYKLFGESIFTQQQMRRFSNTFQFSIWDASEKVFHNSVSGKDVGLTPDTICGTITNNGAPNFYALGEILAWTPLANLDTLSDVDLNVMDVLSSQTKKLINNDVNALKPRNFCGKNTNLLSGCQSFYGFTELVKYIRIKEKKQLKK